MKMEHALHQPAHCLANGLPEPLAAGLPEPLAAGLLELLAAGMAEEA